MIACTRMYNVNEAVAALWRRLLERSAERANVALQIIDYPAPAPLDELWARSDLGGVFMCGWPYSLASPKPQIVAAPVPIGAGCEGPRYRTDLVVRAEAPFERLEDTFGQRIAWTERRSHSGFNAPRHLLLRYGRERLYRESVGPVVTPRTALQSVLEGRADVAPLDSYFHALLRRHEPELAARLRVVAQTECAPIPPLVAAPDAPGEMVERLGVALETAGKDPDCQPLMADLCLSSFVREIDPDDYALAEQWDREAIAASYPAPA